jgi:hypothetical protein
MVLKIYKSADQGATWSYLSNYAAASSPRSVAGGLWEPSFTIAGDGALVCFYSDETQPNHSQLLNHTRSYDGVHWQAPTYVIASNIPQDRPGMAVVTVAERHVLHDSRTLRACGMHRLLQGLIGRLGLG